MGKLIVIGGGARSGKSAFALAYAKQLGARRVFVATAQAFDQEMQLRIARHRDERGESFATVEEPLELADTLTKAPDCDVILVDCLTLWLSNLLLRGDDEAQVRDQVHNVIAAAAQRVGTCNVIIVTNEVGLGLVPETPLGRLFRDHAGWAHQALAGAADEVFLAVMGVIIRLCPMPLTVLRPGHMP